MKSLINKYVRDYSRIVIISDHVSHVASKLIYDSIIETMYNEVKIKMEDSGYLSKITCFDEFEEPKKITGIIPRYDIFRKIIQDYHPSFGDNAILILRCESHDLTGLVDSITTIPMLVVHEADLIIEIIKNKLSIVKDRNGNSYPIYHGIDTHNVGNAYKLNKIIKRIHGQYPK